MKRTPLVLYNRFAQIVFVSVFFAGTIQAGTNFYVDPDWAGRKDGTQQHPLTTLNKSAWQKINTALAHSDVTIYFSALKADRVTQQSRVWFVQCRRTDPSAHRLTLDGHTFYNSSIASPKWLPNPEPDIAVAYTAGKVFKIIGGNNPVDSSMALGWTRQTGNDGVTNGGTTYTCIESHVSSSDNAPGTGPNWTLYWDASTPEFPVGTITDWQPGVTYRCYAKQNNITLRGFEITGKRSDVAGDNLIWEYNWIHDTTDIGPGLDLAYTSHPDGSAAQILARPSTNLIFRNFRIERTYGEGFYLGAINPDATAAFQLAHGNQHSHILIENFLIDQPGINGAQGDGIDCKNGITYLTIRRGEIKGFGKGAGDGINLPMTATNVDENVLVERVFIHDPDYTDETNGKFGIYAATDQASATSLYGLNGVTIRNNIISNCRRGIQYSGDLTIPRPATNGLIFNNTVYNTNPDTGLGVAINVSSTVVKNNFVFGGTDPRGQIGSTGVTSDYNAHDGSWISSSEGSHTVALSTTQALAAVVNAPRNDFHPSANSPLNRTGLTLSNFSDDFYQRSRAPGNWNIGAVQVE